MEGPVTGAGEVLGSWELVRVELIGKPSEGQPLPFGGDPHGVLHYLPDGRMAVLIQEARRPQIAGGRHGGSDAEWREAARKFTAYAGRYSIVRLLNLGDAARSVGGPAANAAGLAKVRSAGLTMMPVSAQREIRLRWVMA